MQDRKLELTSPFKRIFYTKTSRLLKLYEDNTNISPKDWLREALSLVSDEDIQLYLEGSVTDVLLSDLPQTFLKNGKPMDGRAFRSFYDHRLVYFLCYLVSAMKVDHYFRTEDKVKNWLPLYVRDVYSSFLPKLISVFYYEEFVGSELAQINPIMIQFNVLLQSINDGKDSAAIQSEIANSIINTATVAGKVKPIDIMDISA